MKPTKITAPILVRLRSLYSEDGRHAQFTLFTKNGRSFAFTIAFDQLGLMIGTFQRASAELAQRLFTKDERVSTQIATGLARATRVSAVATAEDATNGDTLLWIETMESGAFPFRLTHEALQQLIEALHEHQHHQDANVGAAE